MTTFLNGLRATSIRLVTPWNGAWYADVEVDLGELPDLPTGPAVLSIGAASMVGTIDPVQSGRFGPRARARVVAGAGGWEKPVGAKHYHNDGGVLTTAVLATTAAEVLERVVEASPGRFGIDFVRPAGPAAAVLAGLDWHVDAAGMTIVGPRVPLPASPLLQILEWDARTRVATIATDDVLVPGAILTDARFGTAKIRDIEQTWGDGGARARAWTVAADTTPPPQAGPELVGVIGAIAREAAGARYLSPAQYRVISQLPDGRFTLQTVRKDAGLPDLKAIALAPAVPGLSVKVPPGTVLHVEFVGGDKSIPVVVRFEDGPIPIEVKLEAIRVQVGSGLAPTAGPVALAGAVAAALKAVVVAVAGAANPAAAASALETTLTPILSSLATTRFFAE